MSIGVFQLVKNEARWVGPWLMRIIPFVDDVVIFDGNSTDGTLEIIDEIKRKYPEGDKVRVFPDKDTPVLKDDKYTKFFNSAMWELKTDLAWFLHPDMYVVNPEQILKIKDMDSIAMFQKMRSFAGEPDGKLLEIVAGRGQAWKNIYRLRNPDLGAHYHGLYGAANEDVYFSDITGDSHYHYGTEFSKYPYVVNESGLEVLHFSDVRPYARRYDRMKTCLLNQGYSELRAEEIAKQHPRVTLKSDMGFKFEESDYPEQFKIWDEQFKHLRKEPVSA